MKRSLSLWILALAAMALPQGRVTFQDSGGNMSLRGFRDFQIRNSGSEVRFSGAGSAIEGRWTQQGVTVTGRRAEGVAVRAGKRLNIRSLTISGGATLDSQGQGGFATGTAERFSASFQGPRTNVTAPVAFRLQESRPAQPAQQMTIAGARGTATLEKGEVRAANVAGPVTLTLVQVDRGVTTRFTATGAALTAQLGSTGGTVVLTGNVRVTGDGDVFSGEANVRKATVRLGPNRKPVGVDLEGGAG